MNNDNINHEENEYINTHFRFTSKSKITLHPSKKSSLESYELIKVENYKEIDRYYPRFNKQGDIKIVGKFSIYINAYIYNDEHINYGDITININSGEFKYEKSYVLDNKLKSKNIYEDKIKIEI